MTDVRQGPLHSRHIALGAKLGPFGGWDMPIEYPAGTVAEHTAVRENVGVFDVSHMGKVRVTGKGAYAFINSVFANDLDRIVPGKAQYSMLCNEHGGITDDLIVYLVSDDEVRFIPNASNASTVVAALDAVVPAGIAIDNRHLTEGIVAVQGPKSTEILQVLNLPTEHEYMGFVDAEWNGFSVSVCRTGYTGEHGYELVISTDGVGPLWDAIIAAGALPCGLGARDTLRTEMGYPLHGQDISPDISPVEARIGWAIGWSKEKFAGKDAVTKVKADGPSRVAWGLKATGRGIPRSHMSVKDASGNVIGETTSGTFSPTLGYGIALALLAPSTVEGQEVIIDVRGRELTAEVVKPPFVKSSTK